MPATLTKRRPADTMPEVNDRKPDHRSFDFDEDELDPAINELRPLCLKQRTDTLQWYHALGKLVAKHFKRVEEDREKRNDTMYGQHFFNKLAEAIEVVSAAMLRACFNLYYFYPDGPAFRELAKQKAISPTPRAASGLDQRGAAPPRVAGEGRRGEPERQGPGPRDQEDPAQAS